jgi:hypothetical protein
LVALRFLRQLCCLFALFQPLPFFLMDAKMLRARAVRQVLARPASQPPTTRALHLLMQYVRGHQSRELVNAQLQLGNQLHLLLGN